MSESSEGVRLNKYLASCGVGSRRACDTIIQQGDVYINSSRVTSPGVRVGPDDSVRVGRKVVTPKTTEVILFNKPRGLVSSASDELGRETIYAALPPKFHHLRNVGRLDKESEGLLILTNDGDLALKLTHPSQKVEKEYLVTVNQAFDNEIIDKLISGVHTQEGRAAAKSVKRISPRRLRVVLETGLKRQIRIMFEALHIKVTKLVRVRIGSLEGGGLAVGEWRALDEADIEALQKNPQRQRGDDDQVMTKPHRRRPHARKKKSISSLRHASKNSAKKQARKKPRGRR